MDQLRLTQAAGSEEFGNVNDRNLWDAATSMGLKASRDRAGAVTLVVPADILPPKLRKLAELIATPVTEPASAPAQHRDRETIQAIQPSGAKFEASGDTSSQQDLGGELRGYLAQLARKTKGLQPDIASQPEAPEAGFLEKLRTGGYAASPSLEPSQDFAIFVRRLSASIDRAIDRHGETRRLEHLRAMIDAIYAFGIDRYEREDPARSARLLALGPEIVARLERYKPDPQSAEDRPSQPGPALRIA